MNSLPYSKNENIHDMIVDELFTYKSIAAFVFLIDAVRELEMMYQGTSAFIGRDGSAKHCSVWVNKSEQAFDSVEELFMNATIQEAMLKDVWVEIELEYLY